MTQLADDTLVHREEGVLFTELGDSIVMMDLESGDYYELDDIGSVIWRRIETPTAIADLCEELTREYAVDRETCREHVAAFLGDLIDRKVATIQTAETHTIETSS